VRIAIGKRGPEAAGRVCRRVDGGHKPAFLPKYSPCFLQNFPRIILPFFRCPTQAIGTVRNGNSVDEASLLSGYSLKVLPPNSARFEYARNYGPA